MLTKFPKILKIKSDKSELVKVAEFLSENFKKFDISQKYYNRILLCISEAVINAIEHGNQNDNNKKVIIEMELINKEFHFKIIDEGKGFKMEEIECPTVDENIKKESGRGIHIIKSLTDSCNYNDKGNSIHFKIDVSG